MTTANVFAMALLLLGAAPADSTGELTVQCVDKFYGTSIGAKFHFDSNGVMMDTHQHRRQPS